MKPISKRAAAAIGAKRFFSGTPCPRGHIAERFTSSSTCVVCVREKSLRWQATRKDKVAAISKRWAERHPERAADCRKRSKANNADHYRRARKKWSADNREKMNAYNTVYRAKQSGRLVPQPCAHCGCKERIHAHHENHANRLDVTWLCQTCHNRLHRQRRAA